LSLVKGLAIARGLPLIGIPTLDILAAAQPLSKLPLLVAIQAGRGRLAVGWYKRSKGRWQAKDAPRVVTAKALVEEVNSPTLVCAELSAQEREAFSGNVQIQLASPVNSIRRPAILAELAWARWQAGDVDEPSSLAPIYLHAAEPIPA
jgi:tRNA threonylcarbamoyladenosine biosynthesis protein TsaB